MANDWWKQWIHSLLAGTKTGSQDCNGHGRHEQKNLYMCNINDNIENRYFGVISSMVALCDHWEAFFCCSRSLRPYARIGLISFGWKKYFPFFPLLSAPFLSSLFQVPRSLLVGYEPILGTNNSVKLCRSSFCNGGPYSKINMNFWSTTVVTLFIPCNLRSLVVIWSMTHNYASASFPITFRVI